MILRHRSGIPVCQPRSNNEAPKSPLTKSASHNTPVLPTPLIHLSNPKPGHTTGARGRDGAQRRGERRGRGAAGSGRDGMTAGGCAQDGGGTLCSEEGTVNRAPQGAVDIRPG